MPAALVDSNVLIAATSERDQSHDAGRRIVTAADRGDLPVLRVTNYVLAETLNYVAERGRHAKAVDLYDRLDASAGFELVRSTEEGDRGAIERFRASDALSFVDASLVSYAARNDVEYCYSFDDDLDDSDGATRLQQPTDPYAPG